jgi:hypothetical protein
MIKEKNLIKIMFIFNDIVMHNLTHTMCSKLFPCPIVGKDFEWVLMFWLKDTKSFPYNLLRLTKSSD